MKIYKIHVNYDGLITMGESEAIARKSKYELPERISEFDYHILIPDHSVRRTPEEAKELFLSSCKQSILSAQERISTLEKQIEQASKLVP